MARKANIKKAYNIAESREGQGWQVPCQSKASPVQLLIEIASRVVFPLESPMLLAGLVIGMIPDSLDPLAGFVGLVIGTTPDSLEVRLAELPGQLLLKIATTVEFPLKLPLLFVRLVEGKPSNSLT
jgi:hypothetical protein